MSVQKTLIKLFCSSLALTSISINAANQDKQTSINNAPVFSSFSGMYDYGIQADGTEVLTLSQIKQCLLQKNNLDASLADIHQQQELLHASLNAINIDKAALESTITNIERSLKSDISQTENYQTYRQSLINYNYQVMALNEVINQYDALREKLVQTAGSYNQDANEFNKNCVTAKRYQPEDLAKINGNGYQLVLGK